MSESEEHEVLKAVSELRARLERLSKNFDSEEFKTALEEYAVLERRLTTLIAERAQIEPPSGM